MNIENEWRLSTLIILTLVLGTIVVGRQGDARENTPSAKHESKRERSLDFEDAVVEGMHKQPLDSLTHLGSREQAERSHLYRRRTSYQTELHLLFTEMRYRK